VLGWALVLLLGGVAFAHAFPVSTTPQAGERLAAPPAEVTIHFSERVVPTAARVTIRTPTGTAVPTGPLELSDGDTTVHAPLVRPSTGIYVVSWSVTANDGHDSAGEFAFAAGNVQGAIPAPTIRSTSVPVGESVATALFLLGVSIALGGLCSERFVWRPAAGNDSTIPDAPVVTGLLVGLVGSVAQLVLLVRAEPGGILAEQSWRDVLGARPGLLTVVEIVCLAYALWILRVRRFRPFALVPLAGAVVAAAFRGHSGVTADWWTAPANALHFVLGALWVGALVHLVRVLRSVPADERRATVATAATRYASLALVVIPPLLALGVITALGELDRLGDLVDTTYGAILLVKIILVVVVLGFALAARLRALRPGHIAWSPLRRLTRPEVLALLAVVTVTGFLASSTPPSPAASPGYVLGPPPLTGTVERSAAFTGQLAVYLAATEGTLRIEVLAPGGARPGGTRISVEGTRPSGDTFALFPRRCGPACSTVSTSWPTGRTELTATVSADGWTGGNARFTVVWPPGPDATADLQRIIATMRAQPRVVVREQVSSGPRGRPVPNTGQFTGPEFIAQEPYGDGRATDVRRLPDQDRMHRLSLSLPASDIWTELWFDDAGRLVRQLVVDPGHRIQRTFEYPQSG
jgi:copper transport protein